MQPSNAGMLQNTDPNYNMDADTFMDMNQQYFSTENDHLTNIGELEIMPSPDSRQQQLLTGESTQ